VEGELHKISHFKGYIYNVPLKGIFHTTTLFLKENLFLKIGNYIELEIQGYPLLGPQRAWKNGIEVFQVFATSIINFFNCCRQFSSSVTLNHFQAIRAFEKQECYFSFA
jgi:hypothetical protein